MRKWKREIEKVLEAEGLTDIVWKTTGGNHQKAIGRCGLCSCRRPVAIVTSLTPSDSRTLRNVRADVRRQLRALRENGTISGAEATFT